MKSARRIAYVKRKNNKLAVIAWKSLMIPGFLFFLALAVFIGVKVSTHYWNGLDKISFVHLGSNGNVEVTVLDPKTSELTTLVIPGDTEVDVAMNYGTLRLKNVWQLGVNEKKGGTLLSKSVLKNFSFPVFLWSDVDGINIQTSDFVGILRFVLFPKKTNIPFGDRVNMSLFSLKTKNLDRSRIDLGKSQFLSKQTLADGLVGYKLLGPVSARLTVYFSDNDMSSRDVKVYITDSTGSYGVATGVGQVIEVMGGKIVSLDKSGGVNNSGCQILGKNAKINKKIADILGCKTVTGKTDFDVEIRLGTEFAKTF